MFESNTLNICFGRSKATYANPSGPIRAPLTGYDHSCLRCRGFCHGVPHKNSSQECPVISVYIYTDMHAGSKTHDNRTGAMSTGHLLDELEDPTSSMNLDKGFHEVV